MPPDEREEARAACWHLFNLIRVEASVSERERELLELLIRRLDHLETGLSFPKERPTTPRDQAAEVFKRSGQMLKKPTPPPFKADK